MRDFIIDIIKVLIIILIFILVVGLGVNVVENNQRNNAFYQEHLYNNVK